MLNICLSFDHELFLGENFLPEREILIEPTNRLLDVLVNHKISGTFFTDVCSIIRYKELGMEEFPTMMKDQLQQLIRSGQDVQLHIHANWLKSSWEDGKWIIDRDSYRVQSFTVENKSRNNNWTMQSIIKSGKELLEETLASVNEDYACVAFRAGGFCIQPENELIECLIQNGILIDSSVTPGIYSKSPCNNYDFRDCPISRLNWLISPSRGICQPAAAGESRMFEVPVATTKRNLLNWMMNRHKYIDLGPQWGEFISGGEKQSAPKSTLDRIMGFQHIPVVLSLDRFDARVLSGFVKQIYSTCGCAENDAYISVICHPKLANGVLADNLERFIKTVISIDNIGFCTMRDVYETMKQKGEL